MTLTLSGKWAIDSNILIYALNQESPFFKASQELFSHIFTQKLQAIITQQNLVEAERVLIKVYDKTPDEAIEATYGLVRDYGLVIVAPKQNTYRVFHKLLIAGRKEDKIDVFDYYLAATLLDNDINKLLTVNSDDFSKIPAFTALNPFV